jgi:hypothetical protein
MCCDKCGGTMCGDGYTSVLHCEHVDPPMDAEPDSGPLYCDFKEID